MSVIQEILGKRATVFHQMKDLYSREKKENRHLTADEVEQYDRLDAEYKSYTSQIEDLKKAQERANDFAQKEAEQKSIFDHKPIVEKAKKVEYKTAFDNWMKKGIKGVSPEEQSVLYEKRGTAINVVGTDALGGYAVPTTWHNELVKTMVQFGGMLEVSRIIPTEAGGQINITTIPYAGGGESATQKGHLITETTADTVVDIRMGQKLLNSYVYSSYAIKHSWELMRDSMFPIVPMTLDIGGERVGRIVNEHLTTGTGSGQPNGVVTASSFGKTAAAVAAITADELVDLEHSVDPAYRKGRSVRFMMADATLGAIKKLSFGSSDDRPLWLPSYRENAPDTILGYQYVVNQDMPAMTTGLKSVLFGDFDKYWVRQAGFAEMARSDERYIENRTSVFYVFARYDGELQDANAIKHLIQA